MKIFRANNVAEAIELQQKHNGHYLAGGTDIMVGINSERFQPECLIDISLCKELYGIVEEKAVVKIGAYTTYRVGKKRYSSVLISCLGKGGCQRGWTTDPQSWYHWRQYL